MGIIFMSYRREDSSIMTGRIRSRLVEVFGRKNVYRDVVSIAGGQKFPKHIDKALQLADAEIVVIGPSWLSIADQRGNRRLDNPADFVRHEVEVAIERDIPIIPVMVGGAEMPKREDLPQGLQDLSSYEAMKVGDDPDFERDTDRLIAVLRQYSRHRTHAHLGSVISKVAVISSWASLAVSLVALSSSMLILIGALTWPPSLVDALHYHLVISLSVGGLLLIAALSSLVNLRSGRPSSEDIDVERLNSSTWKLRPMMSLATSSSCMLLFFGLSWVLLLRPSWCSTALPSICPVPQPTTRGAHDSSMDLYFVAIESSRYVIQGSPSQYSIQKLPNRQVGAVRIDQPNQDPYKIVVGVQNLQRGNVGLIIEQVNVVIDAVPPTPYPLNVWAPGSPLDYRTNPFQAVYIGQYPGATLQANYVPLPEGKVQLAPGEADQLDVQLVSRVRAEIRFHIEIVYKSTIAPAQHVLVMPQEFDVTFSDATNWHVFALQHNGQFGVES